ncbi:SWIM zinc finger family protein [Plantactinospora soyae]|uniref:Zn finger protein n=1 Tax=Plantactinospora soyae TaxID=1544732 RepID=A0A927R1E4_9ACTN|nr:SWIM zinc finger family protein [Plantactinospora soyae]MBE1492630.1 putative Zn finger protein [Plantactinospora soyae]
MTGKSRGDGTGEPRRSGGPDFAEYGPPRRVSGGLRARTARGAIGQSWWSRRFLDVLESFALGTRLTRGRSYARAGQVLSLEVAPGEVTALVQGSRPAPYQVSIRLRPFAEPVWARIETLLAAQALFSARLLAGDVPPELEAVFTEAGAPLFPARINELDQRCNCPDFAVPCKHLAATFYLLAEAFDADPFQLLHWRGRDRARLLARLRELRGGDTGADPGTGHGAAGAGATARSGGRRRARTGAALSGVDGSAPSATSPGPAQPAPVGAELALADLPAEPLSGMVDRFWLAPVPLPTRGPTLATEPELVLRQLGPPGAAIGGPGLAERLRRAYLRFGAEQG